MDSKMMLLFGVALLSGWGSVSLGLIEGFGDESKPLLSDYDDYQNQEEGQVQYGHTEQARAYKSCPLNEFAVVGSLNDNRQAVQPVYATMPVQQLAPYQVTDHPLSDKYPFQSNFFTNDYTVSGDEKAVESRSITEQDLDKDLTLAQKYFKYQCGFETKHLVLCPLRCEDALPLKQLFGELGLKFFDALVNGREKGKAAPWILYLKGTNTIIGYCGFDALIDNQGIVVCEFLPEFCGENGYFEEAMRIVLMEGFNNLDLEKVIFEKGFYVNGAQRVRNLGFTSTLLYDRCAGKYVCIRNFSITRDQFFRLDEKSQMKLLESEQQQEKIKKEQGLM